MSNDIKRANNFLDKCLVTIGWTSEETASYSKLYEDFPRLFPLGFHSAIKESKALVTGESVKIEALPRGIIEQLVKLIFFLNFFFWKARMN